MKSNHHILYITATCLLPALLAGCATGGKAAPVPDDWTSVEGHDYYTMSLPPDYQEISVQGIDSYVRVFRSENVDLHLDYGAYGDPLNYEDRPGYQRTDTTIDGRKAYLVAFDRQPIYKDKYAKVVAVHVPRVGLFNSSHGKPAKLTAWTNCVDAEAAEEAKRIFQTIRFK